MLVSSEAQSQLLPHHRHTDGVKESGNLALLLAGQPMVVMPCPFELKS